MGNRSSNILRRTGRFALATLKTGLLAGTVYVVFTTPASLTLERASASIATQNPTICSLPECSRYGISAPPTDMGMEPLPEGNLENQPENDVPEMPPVLVPFFLLAALSMLWGVRRLMNRPTCT